MLKSSKRRCISWFAKLPDRLVNIPEARDFDFSYWPILLQKSKVAGLKIFRENIKQQTIADSYDLNRVTEVAYEFCVRP